MNLFEAFIKLRSLHPRHHNVEEGQVNRALSLLAYPQCRRPVPGRNDAISVARQRVCDDFQNSRFIVGHEDDAAIKR